MWREQRGFYKGEPIVNTAQPITVSVSSTIVWGRRYRPTGPDNLAEGYRTVGFPVASNFTFPIDDSLTIFELIPSGRPALKMNSSCDFRPV